ncbi:MAG: hypothetical protein HY861_03390, partial [Chlamydiia bacterium]|nr:hypothetical protein [Chlamydiia bacterium]
MNSVQNKNSFNKYSNALIHSKLAVFGMTSTFCLCVQSAISNVIMGYRNADSSLLNKGLVQGGGVTIAAAAVYA